MTPAGALTTLVSFNTTKGSYPYAGLARGRDGNFYGTTQQGGTAGFGNDLQSDAVRGADDVGLLQSHQWHAPEVGLALGSDGNFYGTTSLGGASNFGTVFKVTPAGALTTLHSFDGSAAAHPQGELIFGPDGNLYGTANQMVIWRLAPPNQPPATSITSTQATPTNSASATITFTGTDDFTAPGNLTFEGRLDGAAFALVTSPVTLTGLSEDTHTYEVRARDFTGAVDPTPASLTWTVRPLTPVERWRLEHFGASGNEGAAADDADPDTDGLKNVLELAFGTDPNNPDSGPGTLDYVGTLAGGGTIGLRGQPTVRFEPPGVETARALFVRRKDYMEVGLTYTVEFSSDLSTWEPGSTCTPQVLASDTLCEVVSVPYPSAVDGQPAHFVRVRVTFAP